VDRATTDWGSLLYCPVVSEVHACSEPNVCDGNTIVVGADGVSGSATDVNGAVYVYRIQLDGYSRKVE